MIAKIEKSNVEEIFPLSTAQKGMLFHYLKDVVGNQFNVQIVLEIEGSLDLDLMKQSVRNIQANNEVLRSVFNWEIVGKPFQIILKEIQAEFNFQDFSDSHNDQGPDPYKTYLEEDRQRRFDLNTLPIRFGVIKLSSNRYLMHITHHHILYDGWSTGILLKEIFSAYDMSLQKSWSAFSAKPSYKEIQAAIKSKSADKQGEQYWFGYLKGYDVVNLSSKKTDVYESGQLKTIKSVDSDLDLEGFSARNKVTKASIIYAAYAILLQKYLNTSDIVFGTAVSYREGTMRNAENVMGNFINTIPLRLRDNENLSFLEIVLGVHSDLINRNSFNHTSYFEIKQLTGLKPSEDLFDSVIVIENYPLDNNIQNDDLGYKVKLHSLYENAGLPLHITVFFEETLKIDFTYDPSNISDDLVTALSEHLPVVIKSILDNPTGLAGMIDILSPSERQMLLNEFNATAVDYPKDQTIIDLFEAQTVRTPDQTAIIFGKERMSYKELSLRADHEAAILIACGVKQDEVVGLMCERSFELLIGMFGILKAGAAYMPLDPNYPVDRISYMLKDSGARLLLSSASCKENFSGEQEVIAITAAASALPAATKLKSLAQADSLAYVIYTSGSTGRPKGVMIPHRAVVNFSKGMSDLIDFTGKTLLSVTTFSFDIFVLESLVPLQHGATVVLANDNEQHDPSLLQAAIVRNKVNMLQITPSLMKAVTEHAGSLKALGQLSDIMIGGEAFPSALLQTLQQNTRARIFNMYGPTETTVWSSVKELTNQQEITIGKPIANTQVYILDKGGLLQPAGVAGELCISGDGLSRGYLNKPELTAERFIDHPYKAGEKLYSTGDLARWLPDGDIEHLGRMDDQVKIRGYRIELGEIENQLASHAEISEAVVVAKDRNGEKYLVGYYVSAEPLSTASLKAHLSGVLPEYMIPQVYVQLNELPLTPNGKTDRKALPEPDYSTGTVYAGPATELEEKLTGIWSAVLQLDKAQISVTAGFFDLGGHSLKATTLVNMIYKELEVEVPLKAIFSHQDIRSLGAYISGLGKTAYQAIEKAVRKDHYALSSGQQRMYFLYELDRTSLAYNMPYVVELEGELDEDRLNAAFRSLIERHESLRTTFEVSAGDIVQRINETTDLTISHYEAEDAETAISSFIRPFDLGAGPLIRIGLVKVSKDKHLLLADMHHIITDGVSQGILIRDFMELYEKGSLPALSLQYKDYSEWQHSATQQEMLSSQRTYWKEKFSGELSVLDLPVDHSRPPVKSYQGSSRTFTLNREETRQLKALGEGSEATLFMTLLSVLNVLLGKLSNQEDITIGTPIAGRYHAELEGIIGLFVNTLALRNQPKGGLSFREFLEEVKTSSLSGFEHQLYPYEELVNELELPRDTGRNPLFDVMFTFQNFRQDELQIPGLQLKFRDGDHGISKFDIEVMAVEAGEELQFIFEYSTSLFKAETIDRFISYFKRIVTEVTTDANKQLSQIDILSPSECNKILNEFNDTAVDYPLDKTFINLFEKQVKLTPDFAAAADETQEVNYSELNKRANQFAHALLSKGLLPEMPVAVICNRSVDMLVGIIGILKAGGAYVPLSADFPVNRIVEVFTDARPKFLMTASSTPTQDLLNALYPVVNDLNVLCIDYTSDKYSGTVMDRSDWQEFSADNPSIDMQPGNLAYILYTSGSTGVPKGVMIEHKGMLNHLLAKRDGLRLSAASVVAQNASETFDISIWQFLSALIVGGKTVIYSKEHVLQPENLMDKINDDRITIFEVVPSYLSVLLGYLEEKESPNKFSWLEYLLVTGETVQKSLVKRWFNLYSGIKLVNAYGPTEASDDITHCILDKVPATDTVPIGKVLPNLKIYIVNTGFGLCPVGVKGEIVVSGAGVGRGYLNQPEKTSAVFINDPFIVHEKVRMYRTGDVGRWLPDGNIEFFGRQDSQIKINGHRIELGEIESQLLGKEKIREAVVIVNEKEGGKYLAAYYVADKEIPQEQLRKYLSGKLPDYMLPAYYIYMKAFPVSSSGKVDRKNLPDPNFTTGKKYVAPITEEEKLLAEAWSKVLGVERISITDNFFSIGGDSIKSIQVCSAMRTANYKLSVRDIFNYQTIETLSPRLEKIDKISDQSSEHGEVALTGIQQKFFSGGIINKHQYNQSVMLNFPNRITEEEIRLIFSNIQDHHDALRMVYHLDGEQVIQNYQEPGQIVSVRYNDLRGTRSTQQELLSLCNELQSGIDVEHGPLVKLGLFDMDGGSRLLIVIHHLVIDGISWRILFEDIETLYSQMTKGQPLTLPMKTDSFKLWSEKLRTDYIVNKRYTTAVEYWVGLPGLDLVDITRDKSSGTNTFGDTVYSEFFLEKRLTDKLLGDVHRTFNTQINDILLAGFLMSVNKHFGAGALQIDLESHGREEIMTGIDVGRTMGWFTSIFPVTLGPQKNNGLSGLIKSVKESLRSVPNNGVDYLIGTYLTRDILPKTNSQIIFNYMGQFDSDLEQKVFSIATEPTGSNVSPQEQREHDWDVSGIVAGGELSMRISYSSQQYNQLVMDRLMASYKSNLTELIAYCLNYGTRELTPSDLTYKGLTISQLEKLQGKLMNHE
jgi:amino acid adenylation domain-containing protein/non-ribosomal peptide synthase protein (TIGR01720 family)